MATEQREIQEEEEEEEEQIQAWDDWESDEDDSTPDFRCLFCNSRFGSSEQLFDHCGSDHSFDFHGVVRDLGLDFYSSLKLINFVRSQVAKNKCWSCGLAFPSSEDLLNHLHASTSYENDGKLLWEDDMYLKPFMVDDALLHSFASNEDEEECTTLVDKEELMKELMNNDDIAEIRNNWGFSDIDNPEHDILQNVGQNEACIGSITDQFQKIRTNGVVAEENLGEGHQTEKERHLKVSFANVAAREITKVNENYFGAYSSFGIHREMISDKVRMDAYREALLNNPSLMNQATVLDVGCGTGILSLFAAKAGASKVVAVEASEKMASVATQIAKDNGLLSAGSEKDRGNQCSGVINVVQSMIEDLDKFIQIPDHSVDVLVSEWMGYCLLYESMLSSVLYARDRWLRPGGAILPDTATIFIAGFGRGGTSLPFWENVYGFDMSCIGKDVVEDAARLPIVDVVDGGDIVTESVVLQAFDLAHMKQDEMDFTATSELELKSNPHGDSTEGSYKTCWCYGVILWFETGFTIRFCKEKPTVLSTSPYTPKTHWSQTIFTFQEPIAMTLAKSASITDGVVGTAECPAVRIRSRISIARSSHHRSIDISMETTGISTDGRKRSWPVQIFEL